MEIFAIPTVALPLLVSMIFLGRLVVRRGWVPKLTLVGLSCTYVPVPVRGNVCGLPGALSVTDTEPVNVPLASGLKVTLIVQLTPAFTVAPQVFFSANGPDAVMPPTVRVPRPVLVSAIFLATLVVKIVWSEKVKLVGENATAGGTPVPVSGSVWGLSGALSLTEIEPVNVPVALGVNVTLSVQLASGFTVAPQVFVSANGPVAVMVPTDRIPSPVFVSVAF